MAVIQTIKYGSGEIRIHDDYCKNKTPEEIREVVHKISEKVLRFYQRKTGGYGSECGGIGRC